jgi:hypothetical protein
MTSPKQSAKRVADVGRLEISGGHPMKHRGKGSEVVPADESHLDIRPLGRRPIEVPCGFDAH